MERYIRQLALPEMDLLKQERLSEASILIVGAGGLGAVALPYLAGAGIGQVTIIDHDHIDVTNLHRQTIYKTAQSGQSKAKASAQYLGALNPDIKVTAIDDKLTQANADTLLSNQSFDLILDGSDNFETKALLNMISISSETPLISASVNQFMGQIGIFAGYLPDGACYRCLFPDFPDDARNCNEAGIMGTSAGITGMMQAHLALLYLTEIGEYKAGSFFSLNLKTLRFENIQVHKDASCAFCKNAAPKTTKEKKVKNMIEMITVNALNDQDTLIIDVRQPEELVADPLRNESINTAPLNIPLPELIARQNELPQDKRLAFICAGNIRSVQAAEYLFAKGYDNICVLDKFSL